MDTLPAELLTKITDFCNPKSIINLNKVSVTWYFITEKLRNKIKGIIKEYTSNIKGLTSYYRRSVIDNYISNNNVDKLGLMLDLGIIRTNEVLYTFENYLFTNHISLFDFAIKYNSIPVIELFLKYGHNLNEKNYSGVTPLMNCANKINISEQLDLIRYLLDKGADPNVENHSGYIAMDYISVRTFIKYLIKDLLREYGSREGTINDYESEDFLDEDDEYDSQ